MGIGTSLSIYSASPPALTTRRFDSQLCAATPLIRFAVCIVRCGRVVPRGAGRYSSVGGQ